MPDITIRHAATDQDVVTIHQFLCVVAGPTLPGPIDPKKSVEEVWRVATQDIALMALREDGAIVGTMGLIFPEHWWGDVPFAVNRWFFTLPGYSAGKPLLREARSIAGASGLELHIISEARGKITIFNKHKNRSNTNVLRQQQHDLDHQQVGNANEHAPGVVG